MLTNATVKAARPGARPLKLWDAGGLHLLVMPSGHRAWRLRSRAGGRERVMTIGSWPEVSIDVARDRAALVRAGGSLPCADAPQVFEHAARAWHAHMASQWSPTHAAEVLASLERDVFPAIGTDVLGTIAKRDVLAAVRAVEQRGRRETAGRLRQRISAVFDFAMSEDWCEENPAAVRRAMLKPAAQRPHPALIQISNLQQLLADVDQLAGAPIAKLASRFLALTAVRWAAVRGARWDEIEGLDGPEPLWRVPAARMKLAAAKKTSTEHDHLVPLASAAVAVLREARRSGGGALIFPGRGDQLLGERAIADLYARAGYAGRHVPHGWRASFSTILNERQPGDRDAIDLALAHTPKRDDGKIDKVEAAYNRAQHLPRRRRLLEDWAQLLIN
ncbi:MAG: integrase arm-type DNA-binding domain-containing protein [Pseudomonadota bacterium]